MPGPTTPLTLRPLDAALVEAIEPWFDDQEVRAHLGDRQWIRRQLRLTRDLPGRSEGGVTIVGRWGWVAFDDHAPVAFVGVERYHDDTASGCLLVAQPARRRGVGRRVLRRVAAQPELAGVTRFLGGVEPENLASRRCLLAVGADIADATDDEGMLAVSVVLQ